MSTARGLLLWALVGLAFVGPVLGAASSPLLAWRDPIYIAASFTGIVGFSALFLQALLALRLLPGLSERIARKGHVITGCLVLLTVWLHVGLLWLTSPPDVIDALLFVSPTPFSDWGVLALVALSLTAVVALLWRKRKLRWATWTWLHRGLAAFIAITTVLHLLLIEGAMDRVSKWGLSALVLAATLAVLLALPLRRHRAASFRQHRR